MLAIITIIDAVLGATSAAAILLKALVELLTGPQATALAEAATRIVGLAEQMFGSTTPVPQSLGAASLVNTAAVVKAQNEAKWTFALHTLMADVPGTSENDAGIALKTAIKAMHLARPQ